MRTSVAVCMLALVLVVVASSVDAGRRRCEKERAEALELGKTFTPVCTKKGKYKRVQCDEYKCWCVTRRRGLTRFGDFIIPHGEEYDCKKKPSACIIAKFAAILAGDDYVPECTDDGLFVDKQCFGKGEVLPENIVLGAPAFQMDVGANGVPSRAVDGNANPMYFAENSCSHTLPNQGAWWAVDMGAIRNVALVKITNRGDCCADRLSNFYIGLNNESPQDVAPTVDNQQICAHIPEALKASETRSIECQGSGRFLSIILGGTEALTLCEVQVFATDLSCFCVDPNTGERMAETITDEGACPEILY